MELVVFMQSAQYTITSSLVLVLKATQVNHYQLVIQLQRFHNLLLHHVTHAILHLVESTVSAENTMGYQFVPANPTTLEHLQIATQNVSSVLNVHLIRLASI